MNYIELKDLKVILRDVSKDVLIELLHEKMKFTKEDDIKVAIIDIKKDINLRQQRAILLEIDKHNECQPTGHFKWIEHHKEWERMNNKLKTLDREYDKLSIERERLLD